MQCLSGLAVYQRGATEGVPHTKGCRYPCCSGTDSWHLSFLHRMPSLQLCAALQWGRSQSSSWSSGSQGRHQQLISLQALLHFINSQHVLVHTRALSAVQWMLTHSVEKGRSQAPPSRAASPSPHPRAAQGACSRGTARSSQQGSAPKRRSSSLPFSTLPLPLLFPLQTLLRLHSVLALSSLCHPGLVQHQTMSGKV